MKQEPRYRWASVHEWLEWAWGEGKISESQVFDLVMKMDGDTLQDRFQGHMEDDGFFDDLNKFEEVEDGDDEDEPIGF